MNELSSINCETVSRRPTTLIEVILYDDKILNDKSNHQILNATSIPSKVRNGLNGPYFEYLKVILSIS